MACRQILRAIGTQQKLAIDLLKQKAWRQRTTMCRNNLDRQRKTIEPRTDLRNCPQRLWCEHKLGIERLSNLAEKCHRRHFLELSIGQLVEIGQPKRCQREHALPAHT